jgi:hypothetical protein
MFKINSKIWISIESSEEEFKIVDSNKESKEKQRER